MDERVDPGTTALEIEATRREQQLRAPDLGLFEWDVTGDVWTWSDEQYLLHGYEPGAVVPSGDLVISHKLPEDRRRAERILGRCTVPGLTFHNLHGIIDAHGVERLVLSVGSVTARYDADGSPRTVLGGYTQDLTGMRNELVRRLARIGEEEPVRRPPHTLSQREWEVLELIAAGHSNEEIARDLFVSINTVKTYVRTAYRKIGVRRRSQAILWVMDRR